MLSQKLYNRGKAVSCLSRTTGECQVWPSETEPVGPKHRYPSELLISRFFCNTVMAPPADTTGAESSGRGLSATSRVYLVRKAGLKLLKDGMGEYKTMLRNRLRKQGLVDA